MQSRVGSHLSFSDDSDEARPFDVEVREKTNLLQTPPSLSWKTIFLYAIGPLGVDSASLVVGTFFFRHSVIGTGFFYTTFLLEVAKLSPALSGFVFLAGQISDAVTAPAIGKLTDNTNTRWGRRRPWLVLSALPVTILFICLWHTWVSHAGQVAMFAYYATFFVIFNAATNCIIVPLGAFTPDLVETYDQATRLTEMRVIVYTVFSILVVVGHSYLIESWHLVPANVTQPVLLYAGNKTVVAIDYVKGYSRSAILWGILFFFMPVMSGIFLKERQRSAEQVKADTHHGILENVKDLLRTFKSRNFTCLTMMYFLCWTSAQLVQNNLFLYVKYVMKQEDNFMYLVLIVLSFCAPAAFLWGKMSRCAGKRNAYLFGASQWVLVMIALYFMDSRTPVWSHYVLAGCAGICVGVAFLLPWSMLPDVIDEDELLTGKRSEGSFYSIFILIQKLGAATALGSSNWILGLSGYDGGEPGSPPPLTQPESVITALKVMTGPLGSVMIFLSMIPMIFYKLERERVVEIRRDLKDRTQNGGYKKHVKKEEAEEKFIELSEESQ